MKQKKHRILARDVAYNGFLSIERYRVRHTLFEGGWGEPLERELLERGRVAAVLPYDPVRDQVALIEQFRIGAIKQYEQPWLLEVVAGVIEPGEDAETLARREAVEEAGCELAELVRISEFLVSPGCTTEHCTLYCGRADLAEAGGIHGVADEGENILVHVMSAERAIALLHEGAIRNATSIIALSWLANQRLAGTLPFAG